MLTKNVNVFRNCYFYCRLLNTDKAGNRGTVLLQILILAPVIHYGLAPYLRINRCGNIASI